MSGRRVVGAAVVLAVTAAILLRPGGMLAPRSGVSGQGGCAYNRTVWLVAQSVPSGSFVPCVPTDIGGADLEIEIGDAGSSAEASDATGLRWSLDYSASCEPGDAEAVAGSQPPGITVLESLETSAGRHLTRYYVFEGGCVVSALEAPERIDIEQAMADAEDAFILIQRAAIDDAVADLTDGALRLDP